MEFLVVQHSIGRNVKCVCLFIFGPHINKIILIGKPEGKQPLARPRRRCEHNIRMDLR